MINDIYEEAETNFCLISHVNEDFVKKKKNVKLMYIANWIVKQLDKMKIITIIV